MIEYDAWTCEGRPEELAEHLNEAAAEGWRLFTVHIESSSYTGAHVYYVVMQRDHTITPSGVLPDIVPDPHRRSH